MWFCGIILACKIGLESACDRFSGGFGRFLGGYCASAIVEHYHLSDFFVWVVYALCILLGAGICGPFYYFWSKWWFPNKPVELHNKYVESKNKYGIIVINLIAFPISIIWLIVMAMGIGGAVVGGILLYAQYLQWFRI
ncbi:hypothetical protein [Helicobacter pylori]|uniref:hypothetical protein n=1 Tax=Helicobacter pylori TaxID=210 RepID=UPI00165CE159|nr:hypothetical protein [Helicobacter pylori]